MSVRVTFSCATCSKEETIKVLDQDYQYTLDALEALGWEVFSSDIEDLGNLCPKCRVKDVS